MILYFTTLNKSLFDISGYQMINSFKQFCKYDHLVVFYEELKPFECDQENITILCVKNAPEYNNWFKSNLDIIPKQFGGSAENTDKRLSIGHAVKWNIKACKWFWKIVACMKILELVRTSNKTESFSHIVMIDCDTEFLTTLNDSFWNKILPVDTHCGYHLGPYRSNASVHHCSGVESGILVFNNSITGYELVQCIINKFIDGSFRSEIRWDDGYIIRKVVEHRSDCYDFSNECNKSNVIAHGPFKNRIIHHKGTHRKLNL